MVKQIHRAFKANDRSYFAILKKEIHALAVSARFSARKVGEIDIIVAELTSNLSKHAGGGQVLVKVLEEHGVPGIEIVGIDSGPGMSDVSRMMPDGVSTKNTLGHGLGAMKRLSDLFQIYSLKDWGTVMLIRVFEKERPAQGKPPKIDFKSIIVPKPGEVESGDGFYCTSDRHYLKLFLGDGLGHGPAAARAVAVAGDSFSASRQTDPVEIIREINTSVKKTRGLVGTVAVFDLKAKQWRICGVGNILTKIMSLSASKNYVAYNGIIGLNVPNTLNAQQIPYESGQHLIMCSDGLRSRWDILRYPSILRYDPTILAGVLLKDFARHTDDMSAVVCKLNF